MIIDEIAKRLSALANVVAVTTGPSVANGQGPDHLHIVAMHPAPFDTIAKLTEGVRAVDVTVATPVAADAGERFRPDSTLREVYDRDGNHGTPGEAKLFAANIGITTPPTLSAIHDGKLGVLFATVADAEAYDRAAKGALA